MTAPSPRFSLVVPLYNKGRYIEDTLATVLAQTVSDFEVIVIDDGSTDDGPARVAAVSDHRVRLHRIPNSGVSRARNCGIGLARGEWVAFLDADDWLHQRYLETLIRVISQHPNVDFVATRYRDIPIDVGLSPTALPTIPDHRLLAAPELIDDLPRRWLQGPVFFTSSAAIRRTRLLAMQPCFPEDESYGEDLDLWFRVSRYTEVAMHPVALVWRIVVPGSLTSAASHYDEPPFLQRLLQEAATIGTPPPRAGSLRRFVRISRLLLAREAIVHRRAGRALPLLCRSFVWKEPRWWLTALLLFIPSSAAKQWHDWRNPPPKPIRQSSRA